MTPLSRHTQNYRPAFLAFLAHSDEATLHAAYELGRAALADNVSLLDFIPAVLTGVFAFAATVGKQPILGLLMLGVVPMALYLTLRQLRTQTGILRQVTLIMHC